MSASAPSDAAASPHRPLAAMRQGPAAQPLEAIAGFAALLRDHGLKVGIAEQQAMVEAALRFDPSRHARLAEAWRAIACHDARDWRRWPELYERYWRPNRQRGQVKVGGLTRPSRSLPQLVQNLHERMAAESPPGAGSPDTALQPPPAVGEADEPGAARAQGGATRSDPLHDRALSQWLPQDLAQLDALAERIARRLRKRLTRRWFDERHGPRLDLRRTLRASLRTGGVPVAPVWRAARRERPRLFVLVDVSRSMETHAQLFLRIARAFVQAMSARVFVFHTRLAEVTPLLRSDSAAVQEKVNAVTAGFGGGTRIATSVDDFHRVHARAQLGRSARVWVLSDGFDADPPEQLAAALRQVRGHGARITWLHPGPAAPASAAMTRVWAEPGLVERCARLHSLADLAAFAARADLLR